ncbi:hypothetical protein A2U01_0110560, partial [Trifolium medium]|nr:hypothetical protein [Trifolium medium]
MYNTPPPVVIAAQRRFADHSPLLFT